jgi:hypothetical protein
MREKERREREFGYCYEKTRERNHGSARRERVEKELEREIKGNEEGREEKRRERIHTYSDSALAKPPELEGRELHSQSIKVGELPNRPYALLLHRAVEVKSPSIPAACTLHHVRNACNE